MAFALRRAAIFENATIEPPYRAMLPRSRPALTLLSRVTCPHCGGDWIDRTDNDLRCLLCGRAWSATASIPRGITGPHLTSPAAAGEGQDGAGLGAAQ